MSRYFLRHEVLEMIAIRPELLDEIEAEGLIDVEQGARYSLHTVERLRVIRNLVDDLGVNLAGAEVILRMREQMMLALHLAQQALDELQRQVDHAGRHDPLSS